MPLSAVGHHGRALRVPQRLNATAFLTPAAAGPLRIRRRNLPEWRAGRISETLRQQADELELKEIEREMRQRHRQQAARQDEEYRQNRPDPENL